MRKKGNIAIFVPHLGCPNQCSFCNQRTITHTVSEPDGNFVREECRKALEINKDKDIECEIAFFGGSFTAIEYSYMTELLEAASEFLDNDRITGIRISTRPDAIDEKILDTLKHYGVTAIELGAQSMDEEVLKINRRGHTAQDVFRASEMIKSYGFSLGLQMMTGLYGDSDETILKTARDFIKIKPDTVRIYPTVVLKNTYLDILRQEGRFTPRSAEDSVEICAELMEMFKSEGIKVIRVGLHAEEWVENDATGGAYHPAMRELCESRIFLKKILKILDEKHIPEGNIEIFVNPRNISKVVGQKKSNIVKICDLGYNAKVRADSSLNEDEIMLSWDRM